MTHGKSHTEEEIIKFLKEGESGVPVPDLLRKHGISQGTHKVDCQEQ